MSHIYAMQRANGDWFAFDDKGRFAVPLFHSRRDAMIARSRNWGMMLFKPVALNSAILKELIPIGGESDVAFWLVNDPLVNMNRGHLVEYAQLVRLMQTPIELQVLPRNGNSSQRNPDSLPQKAMSAIETWEDEGGNYSNSAVSYRETREGQRLYEGSILEGKSRA